jgi:dolichol-phosphate mannosyltransferase
MISIVIPVYNEEDNLDELLRQLNAAVSGLSDDLEFIFINDGSSDGSGQLLDRLSSEDSRLTVIHLLRNFGQTAALMAGFDHARGDIVVCLDADLQNDPDDIPSLLDKLDEGFDVVSGWRKNRKDAFFSRVLVSRIANSFISSISGVRMHDYGCSLKAYRASTLEGIRLYGEMHRLIPIYARWQGARIAELEVKHHARKHGASNYGIERVFKVVMDLIVVEFLHQYNQKPMYIFGAAGLVSFLAAFVAGALALYYKFLGDKSFIETPLPLLVALTTTTGFMCFLMGLLAELIVRTYYEAQGKRTYIVERISNPKS